MSSLSKPSSGGSIVGTPVDPLSPGGSLVDLATETTGILPAAKIGPHAPSHKHGGTDEVATAVPGANEIPKADGTGVLADGWLPAGIARDAEVTTAVSTHAGAADPHTGYQKESEKDAALGYAGLDASANLAKAELPPGTLVRIAGLTSEGTSTITGTTAFVTKPGTTFTPAGGPFTGTFRLDYTIEFSHDTAGGDTEVKVRRTDVGPSDLAFAEEEAADGDDWNVLAGFILVTLAAVSPTFDFQFRTVASGEVASVRRARFEWTEVVA